MGPVKSVYALKPPAYDVLPEEPEEQKCEEPSLGHRSQVDQAADQPKSILHDWRPSPESQEEEANDLLCPITMMLMTDPVIAADGHSYERTAIEKWLKDNDTSP